MLDFTTRTPEILLWLGLIILVAAIVFYALAGSTRPLLLRLSFHR